MQTLQVPPGPIKVSDPNSVPETWANGPFNIINEGTTVVITLTTARPDIGQLIAGNQSPPFAATVVARIMLPVEMASELVRILGQNLATTGPAAGHA